MPASLVTSSTEMTRDKFLEKLAHRGRMLLWCLLGLVVLSGVLARYFMPAPLYADVFTFLAGEYVAQEAVLARNSWIDVSHRLLGTTLLVAGMCQFDANLRRSRPAFHRWTGRLFLVLAWLVGVGGLSMGLIYPFGGLPESIFVATASILLFACASMAWLEIRRRRFAQHREWMIRTLGLLFFVTIQRVYYTMLVWFTDWPNKSSFTIAAWCALLTVMIAAEGWIRVTRIESTQRHA